MQEFLQKSKKMTSIDKLNILLKDIPITKLSETLAAELTSNDKGLNPFWKTFSKKISEKLWLPRQIDFQGSGQAISSDGCLNILEPNLRHLTRRVTNPELKNLPKNYLKLSQFLPQDITAKENIITRKVRFYPTLAQQKYLTECFGAHRFFYNRSLTYIQDVLGHYNKTTDRQMVRDKVLVSDKTNPDHFAAKWTNRIYTELCSAAIHKAGINFDTNMQKVNKKQITHFSMNMLSKQNKNQVCYFPAQAMRDGYKLTPTIIKKHGASSVLIFKKSLRIQLGRDISGSVDGEFSITKDTLNHYHINIPKKIAINYDNANDNRASIVALDPGVRTFQTYYSPEEFGDIGTGLCDIYQKIDNRITKLKSVSDQPNTTDKTRNNIRRKCCVLRAKIRNITRDLHWKTAKYLTSKYKVILIPKMNIKSMLMSKKLPAIVKQNLVHLSHFAFRQRLIHKGIQNNSCILLCSEAYTTKTCGECGMLYDVETNKTYTCPSCNLVIDRDVNAARNILIRSLGHL